MNRAIPFLLSAALLLTAGTKTAIAENQHSDAYQITTGDKVRVSVYGHEDLSGEFEVDNAGRISLPLIRHVTAGGLTADELAIGIRRRLQPDYLRDPKVSVEVIAYQPIFVLGEVRQPGSYTYSAGMTVVKAIALAGGYTYRADKSDIVVTRSREEDNGKLAVDEQAVLMPGDVVEVPERFF